MKLNVVHSFLALVMNLSNVRLKIMMNLKLTLIGVKILLMIILYPTDGVNNSIYLQELPFLLGDYRYFNLNADHKSYRPVSETTTLKLTGNFNISKGYSGKSLPFYKRNFGGGSGSVRGFGNKTLGPLISKW